MMMDFEKAKDDFIDLWGQLGPNWGINKTMAQIHALLLISPSVLSTDEIMDQLKISRGNSNMNVRILIDWGLVHKSFKRGDRKEYFSAEKDMPTVAKCIIIQRRKKELEPLLKLQEKFTINSDSEENEDQAAFNSMIEDISIFANKSMELSEKLMNAEEYWLVKTLSKWI